MSVEITRETITPERAKELLAMLSPHQRNKCKPTPNHVEKLARDMRNGLWDEEVVAPIMISDEGYLLDGMHRMTAVVLAGRPIKFYVAEGVPEASFSHIDIGKKRQAADFYTGKNRMTVCAVAKCVGAIECGSDLVQAFKSRLTENEVLGVIDRHERELQTAVDYGMRIRGVLQKRGAGSAYAMAVYVAASCNEDVDRFIGDFTGDQSILTVRTVYRRLQNILAAHGKSSPEELCGVLLYGIHAVAVGNDFARCIKSPIAFLRANSDYYTAPIREAAQ